MRTLFLFFALIFITSCDKNELATMVYEETQCSDVWETSSTSGNSTEEMVINYFKETHDIELKEISIKTVNTGAACLACTCSSGREIEVSVDDEFVTKMETEGFVRK